MPLRYRAMYSASSLFGAVSYWSEFLRGVFDLSDRGAFECVRHVDIALRSLLSSALSAMSGRVLMMYSDSFLPNDLSFICRDAFRIRETRQVCVRFYFYVAYRCLVLMSGARGERGCALLEFFCDLSNIAQ